MKRQDLMQSFLCASWMLFILGSCGAAWGVTIDFTTLAVADPNADPLQVGRVRFFGGKLLNVGCQAQ